MLTFHIITIFPDVFTEYFNTSIIKRAQQKGLIKIKIHNLRDFTKDKHKTVDDKPYGGGPGMVLKADIIYKALSALRISNFKFQISKKMQKIPPKADQPRAEKIKNKKLSKIILLTPAGKQFDQKMAESLSKLNQLVLICGRYEGIDARVEKFVDEKISVGPYVLSGGELPAMTMVEAITRLVPGVIRAESLQEESFTMATNYKSSTNIQIPKNSSKTRTNVEKGQRKSALSRRKSAAVSEASGEYPQYTRPEILTIREKNAKIKTLKVPKVLLSGNHGKIRQWRQRAI